MFCAHRQRYVYGCPPTPLVYFPARPPSWRPRLHAVTTSALHTHHETIGHFDDPPVPRASLCSRRVGHSTVSTLSNEGEVSADPLFGFTHRMSSTRHQAHVFHARPGRGFFPPAVVLNITRQYRQVLPAVCPPQKADAVANNSGPNLLALRRLEGLGKQHAVVGALSAMRANYLKGELALRAVFIKNINYTTIMPYHDTVQL